jgi:hypothetical protein
MKRGDVMSTKQADNGADLSKREIRRQQLLQLFKRKEPIWKDEDHPELKDGAVAWVRKMRAEGEARFQNIQKQRDQIIS